MRWVKKLTMLVTVPGRKECVRVLGCGREQGSCESSSRRETDGDGPHRLRLSTKRVGHNPPVPFGLWAAWGHLLCCGHLKLNDSDCVPDASYLTPRRP